MRPHTRKGETGRSDPCTMYRQVHSGHKDKDEPWIDRYRPYSKVDLAVHKKKVEEVENWLKLHTEPSQGGLLLLRGPSGCGKTATINVLSRELGFRIQEWINPPNLVWCSQQVLDRTTVLSSTSQSAQFQEFLLRSNKYNCLKMVGDTSSTGRSLILVEEFPNQFYRNPSGLHDILRYFVKTRRCLLVFIVSNSASGDSSSRVLFPRELMEELDISDISFNPVAPTTMMKVLTRILSNEDRKRIGRVIVPDQTVLEMISSGSSGDIRSAINCLQFASVPDHSLEKGLVRRNNRFISQGKAVSGSGLVLRKNTKPTKGQEGEPTVGMRDTGLFLFRALGKILHCKRVAPECVKTSESAFGLGLPSHLSLHHRESLLVDPERVIERSYVSGEFFNLYLHQNYLDFFSEMEDVHKASEYMSDADLLTSDWMSGNTLDKYASAVATRGLLHTNSQQVAVGFRPLHKPNWLLVNKKHREKCLAAQCLFRHLCMTPVSLQTELLPFLAKFTNRLSNQDEITFIQDVGHMPMKRFPVRLKLEALTDQEVHLKIDSLEDIKDVQKGSVECLSANHPQYPTTSVTENEKTMMIEEYNSD
ncbi:cell cycle checkpoint protein RAD17 isoform X3 [Syngnathus scovelli]|uniref:cell cycle checkpoint protein RAD17 isoform X3 n=1 Tax=Syngnathus scovelli TaxID=161590 RepID=UPI00210F8A30|nr:cell cycle checkpoint protein RAD17 isoform X3 [Syngnathus scovelli]